MSPGPQSIAIWSLDDRRKRRPTAKPWVVRWRVDVRQFSRAFSSRAEAERFRSTLITSQTNGVPFSAQSGLPATLTRPDSVSVHQWARRWLDEQWDSAEPRTRRSWLEALAWFVVAATNDAAQVLPQDERKLRLYLQRTLGPERGSGDGQTHVTREADDEMERALSLRSLRLDQLDRARMAEIERKLRTRIDGSPRGSSGGRYVKVAKKCLRRAVELEVLAVDPWPPAEPGMRQRKIHRVSRRERREEIRRLPTRLEALEAITRMTSHQPGSDLYVHMSRVALDTGARPSEIIDLEIRHLRLPEDGWGKMRVEQAYVGREAPGSPKTSPREVPLAPATISMLRDWITSLGREDGFLFRTRSGKRPTLSNWWRSLQRGCQLAEITGMSPYDLRHICATTMIACGVPLGEAALRLGHSVEELVRTYIGVFTGDEELGNRLLERVITAESMSPRLPDAADQGS